MVVRLSYEKYSRGDIVGAVEAVLSSPQVCYDFLDDGSSRYWLNYIDALAFGTYATAYEANKFLQGNCSEKSLLACLCYDGYFLELAQSSEEHFVKVFEESRNTPSVNELLFCLHCERQGRLVDGEAKRFVGDTLFDINLRTQWSFSQNILRFRRSKQALSNFYRMVWRPYVPLKYSCKKHINFDMTVETPVFFMELYDLDWKKLLKPWRNKNAVFVFYDISILWQSLQFDYVLKALLDPKHVIVLLDVYLNDQLFIQERVDKGTLFPVMLAENPLLMEHQHNVIELLADCLYKLPEYSWVENSCADDLYQLGKTINNEIKMARLGESRFFAQEMLTATRNWWEIHPNKGREILRPKDYRTTILERDFPIKKRADVLHVNKKQKVVHVVHRLIDQGYAPTKRLLSILKYYDFDKYDVYVVVTEQNVYRPREYPYRFDADEKTEQRGKKTIDLLQEMGIIVYVDDATEDFVTTAQKLSHYIDDEAIDTVVFHDCSSIISLMSHMVDTAEKIFFVHGALPDYNGFDSVVVAFEEEAKRYKSLGMKVFVNPVGVNLTTTGKAVSKEDWGLDEHNVILTTVSNMLDTRLSVGMCLAIGEILRECPQAYYMPIGYVSDQQRLMDIFSFCEVDDRVIFLGQVDEPFSLLLTMDIYLNDFPVGGGLAVLEAMAAGCPVVAMYDLIGNYKSREGGNYFGVDYTVSSFSGYIAMACRLIEDRAFRGRMSDYARERYKYYSDEEAYSFRHQSIINMVSVMA